MVYAGGIVVFYVFSILLTSGEGDVIEKLKRSRFLAGLGATRGRCHHRSIHHFEA